MYKNTVIPPLNVLVLLSHMQFFVNMLITTKVNICRLNALSAIRKYAVVKPDFLYLLHHTHSRYKSLLHSNAYTGPRNECSPKSIRNMSLIIRGKVSKVSSIKQLF